MSGEGVIESSKSGARQCKQARRLESRPLQYDGPPLFQEEFHSVVGKVGNAATHENVSGNLIELVA
jgi:hypothetical protein